MFYYIDPEVAGGLGENTVMDTSQHPPVVHKLEYEFQGWLGDELLEAFPCFIVSKSLGDKLTSADLSGFKLDKVEVSRSDLFDELNNQDVLPAFLWLKVTGEPGVHDFGLAKNHRLVISISARHVLDVCRIAHADFEVFKRPINNVDIAPPVGVL